MSRRRSTATPLPPRYRRRRRVFAGLLVLLVLAGAVVGGRVLLLRSPWFRVAQIDVAAPAGMNADTLRAVTGIRPGQPLLTVDVDGAGRNLGTLAPVASATVTRHWPHTVRVEVVGRTPVALTPSAEGPWLVDHTGLAYQPAGAHPPALPVLRAARVSPADPATRSALRVLAALTPSVRGKVQVVEAETANSVLLRLAGNKQVLWGTPDASDRKARVLEALLSQTGSYYDVSAPDLPTLRR
jgi:cell division protein FtsQ